jgi:hypothetical protein
MSGEYAGKAQWLKFAADARDMHRYAVGFRLIVDAPDIDEKLPLGNALTLFFSQTPKEFKLSWMERKPVVIDPSIAVKKIQGNLTRLPEAGNKGSVIGKKPACDF